MFEPQNEQGVVFLFGQYVSAHADCIELVEIQTAFPDAVIKVNGVTFVAEFEYMASNFITHGHDVRECDLVICWENDAPEDFPLPVFALSSLEELGAIDCADPTEKELWYWKHRAEVAARRVSSLEKQLYELTGIEDVHESISVICEKCGREFGSVQALSAHGRFCDRR